jgi:hypothetical protein
MDGESEHWNIQANISIYNHYFTGKLGREIEEVPYIMMHELSLLLG